MKAILIDPVTQKVSEVEHNGDYKEIYKLLSDPANDMNVRLFEIIDLGKGETLFVDEEGLLHNPKFFFKWDTYRQPLAGRGLILGTNRAGDSTSTKLTVADVEKHVRYTQMAVEGFVQETGTTDHPLLGEDIPYVRSTPVFGPPGLTIGDVLRHKEKKN